MYQLKSVGIVKKGWKGGMGKVEMGKIGLFKEGIASGKSLGCLIWGLSLNITSGS